MKKSGTLLPIFLLTLCAIAALVAVFAPTAALQPFAFHTSELIERSYRFDRIGRWLALGLLVVGGGLFWLVWKRAGRLARTVATVPMVALLGAAFFSGEHLLEWMVFEPLESVRFVALEEATHVADDDLVMGILVDGQARTYPVQMVAYHHIVNDRLAGEPYVVTF